MILSDFKSSHIAIYHYPQGWNIDRGAVYGCFVVHSKKAFNKKSSFKKMAASKGFSRIGWQSDTHIRFIK